MARILWIALLVLSAGPVSAAEYSAELQMIQEYNRMQPLQNPDYQKTEKILNRRVLDSRHKVVGEVEDVILTPNGSIASLKVDFDRLRLGSPVYMNYSSLDIDTVSNAYQMRQNDDQVASMYPALMADIETAAGAEEEVALSTLPGLQVISTDGQALGTVQDVLFSADGSRAEALYVGLTHGVLHGKSVAIPFKSGTVTSSEPRTVMVEKTLADAMISYAGER